MDTKKMDTEKVDTGKMDTESNLEREKFEFEKSIREREFALKEKEARFGTRLLNLLPAMVPLFVVLVASYFAYRQFVQTQQDTVKAQARAAIYTAATEQYQAVLQAKQGQIKRKDTDLDTLNENVKTIRGLIDGPEFLNQVAYQGARKEFYTIESSVIPLIKTPDLEAAVSLFEKGIQRSEQLARKSGVPDDYENLNAAWKTLHKRLIAQDSNFQDKDQNTDTNLPRDYAGMVGYLATSVNEVVEIEYAKNADPNQFGTVTELFNQAIGTTAPSKSP